MNETEVRRKQLLEETRRLYQESGSIPIVHPRFGKFTNTNEPAEELSHSSFKMRFLLALILLAIYVGADYYGYTIGIIHSEDIASAVSFSIDVEDVWRSL